MVNRVYAGTPADFAIALGAQADIVDEAQTPTGADGWAVLIPVLPDSFDVYDADGTPYTDLVDSNGGSVSVITASAVFDTAGQILMFTVNDAPAGDVYLVGTGGTVFEDPTFRLSPATDEIFDRIDVLEARGLSDLPDVNITGRADDQFVKWDGTAGEHVYADAAGIGTVTSVAGVGPTAGDVQTATLLTALGLSSVATHIGQIFDGALFLVMQAGSGYPVHPADADWKGFVGTLDPGAGPKRVWIKPRTT